MTREQAQRCWSQIEQEIEGHLMQRRPKLKSFEMHHSFAVARQAIIAIYADAPSHAALREAAFRAIGL